jgi:hypothetical protein
VIDVDYFASIDLPHSLKKYAEEEYYYFLKCINMGL